MYKLINKNSFKFGHYIFNNVSINKYKNGLKNYKPNQNNILRAYSDYISGSDKNIPAQIEKLNNEISDLKETIKKNDIIISKAISENKSEQIISSLINSQNNTTITINSNKKLINDLIKIIEKGILFIYLLIDLLIDLLIYLFIL